MKELKALLPLINYKAPSSRILKEKFQVLLPGHVLYHPLSSVSWHMIIFLDVISYKTTALVQPVHLATCRRMNHLFVQQQVWFPSFSFKPLIFKTN